MRIVRMPFALAVLLALGIAPALAAQRAVLHGRIVDAQSGAALTGVLVQVTPDGRSAATDQTGAFRLRLRAGRDHMLTLSRLGYLEQNVVVSALAEGDSEPMTFAMTPEPLVLERVEVLVDRFEARRHSVPMSSYVLGRERLVRYGGGDLVQFVRSGAMLTTTSCEGVSLSRLVTWASSPVTGSYCIHYRGGVVAPTVYVDDRRAFAGLDELHGYSPLDVHHVEIYQRGTMIRVYTLGYVERLARSNRRLPGMDWW